MDRLLLLSALVCVVTPSAAQTVRVDYDHGRHFSRYKTYRWVQSPAQQPGEAGFPNQLMRERITSFVEEALAAKRYTRVEKDGDLLVHYQVNVTEQPQFITFTDSIGPGWGWGSAAWVGPGWAGAGWVGPGWGSGTAFTTTQLISMGTLVVDLKDARQNQLVFQGVSTSTISSRPEKNIRRLRRGINEMFEKYPPQP
jgi:hypothetical protein